MALDFTQPYGTTTVWTLGGRSMPEVSPLTAGSIYFDRASGKFMVSEDGGAYVQLVGGGGGGSLQDAYDLGASISTGAGGPVVIGNPAGPAQPALVVSQAETSEPAARVEGAIEVVGQVAQPNVPPASSGSIYYDAAQELFLASQGGGLFRPLSGVATELVYRPGDPDPGPNVFTTWPDLVAAMNAPEALRGLRVISVLDDLAPATVPAGAWSFQGPGQVVIRGVFGKPPLGTRTILTFQDGATLGVDSLFYLTDFIALFSVSSSPVIVVGPGDGGVTIYMDRGAALGAGSTPFISAQDPATTNLIAVGLGALLANAGAPAIELNDPGATLILSIFNQGVVDTNALSGVNGSIALFQIESGAVVSFSQPSFSGFTLPQLISRHSQTSMDGDFVSGPATYDFPLELTAVGCDASGGDVDVNLPPVMHALGREVVVKRLDATANAVSLIPFGAETIDGSPGYALIAMNQYVRLLGSPFGWFVIGG